MSLKWKSFWKWNEQFSFFRRITMILFCSITLCSFHVCGTKFVWVPVNVNDYSNSQVNNSNSSNIKQQRQQRSTFVYFLFLFFVAWLLASSCRMHVTHVSFVLYMCKTNTESRIEIVLELRFAFTCVTIYTFCGRQFE